MCTHSLPAYRRDQNSEKAKYLMNEKAKEKKVKEMRLVERLEQNVEREGPGSQAMGLNAAGGGESSSTSMPCDYCHNSKTWSETNSNFGLNL